MPANEKPQKNLSKKVSDVGFVPVSSGGRLDKHWRKNGVRNFAKQGKESIRTFIEPFDFMSKYLLKGLEWGNWVTNEDRINFLQVADLGLGSFAKALGLKNKQIGLMGTLGLAYGARGSGAALAHFEPGTFMINLTRYQNEGTTEINKPQAFFGSGGLGSFAHEWGHALDYFLGGYFDQDKTSMALSYGQKVITAPSGWTNYERINFKKGSYRWIMREILATIIFSERGKKFTPYYGRLVKKVRESPIMGTYWIRTNELFARVFEQYVHSKLDNIGIKKGILVKKKYKFEGGTQVYVNPVILKKVKPLMDSLLKKAQSDLRTE